MLELKCKKKAKLMKTDKKRKIANRNKSQW